MRRQVGTVSSRHCEATCPGLWPMIAEVRRGPAAGTVLNGTLSTPPQGFLQSGSKVTTNKNFFKKYILLEQLLRAMATRTFRSA